MQKQSKCNNKKVCPNSYISAQLSSAISLSLVTSISLIEYIIFTVSDNMNIQVKLLCECPRTELTAVWFFARMVQPYVPEYI